MMPFYFHLLPKSMMHLTGDDLAHLFGTQGTKELIERNRVEYEESRKISQRMRELLSRNF